MQGDTSRGQTYLLVLLSCFLFGFAPLPYKIVSNSPQLHRHARGIDNDNVFLLIFFVLGLELRYRKREGH